jgi:hypothetical protein
MKTLTTLAIFLGVVATAGAARADGVNLLIYDDRGYIYHACVNGQDENSNYQSNWCFDMPNYLTWLSPPRWLAGTKFQIDLYDVDWTYRFSAYPWPHFADTLARWCFSDNNLLDDGWPC